MASQCHVFFFTTEFAKSNFFTLSVVNDNEIVRSTSDGVEGKSGFLLVSKLSVPTCLAISGIITLDNG